jgi:hypothetical protein
MTHKSKGLAHLKLDLHATSDTALSWQYGLIDSGCTDNFVSIKALQSLSDYGKIKISPTTSKTIRTANNDQSQEIHGTVNLSISVLPTSEDGTTGQVLTFDAPFFVVSGLVYQVFIGQTFLTSPYITMETSEALYFNMNHETHPNIRENMHKVFKTYKTRKTACIEKRVSIPPDSAVKVQTNLLFQHSNNTDIFHYFEPCTKFRNKFPGLHIPLQTCLGKNNLPLEVMVVNTSSAHFLLKRSEKLGILKSELKTTAVIQPLSDFIPAVESSVSEDDESPVSEDDSPSLNAAVLQTHHTVVPFDTDHTDPIMQSNTMSTFHEHPLTNAEIKERNETNKNQGFFHKTVTETLDDSNNTPTFEYTGENQFTPKSDNELLSDCDLSHLSPDHKKLTIDMLKRNIHAFQRHPLDIGKCKNITASAPLTEPNPPMLYAKYVPIPLKYKVPAQKLIDEYCKAGVLAQTTESCRFTSNIFIIPKKDNTFRLIFYGRILSKYCQALPLALGNFDEIFAELAGKQFVSKLDVSKAYDQIAVTPETSRMLSFFGPDAKRYIYLRAGQGLKFSSFFLNQAMDSILFGMENVKSYCDDVFCSSADDFESHLRLLEEIIQRFHSYNVKLNISKLEVAPKQL